MSLEKELTLLSDKVKELDDCIELYEATLKDLKLSREKILTDDIPATLDTYGIESAKLTNGREVKIEEIFSVKSADLDRAALVRWLVANDMGDIVKDVVEFEKGNIDDEMRLLLESGKYNFTRKSDIAAKTLQAAIKRHVEAGGELPPSDACEVNIFRRAKIK